MVTIVQDSVSYSRYLRRLFQELTLRSGCSSWRQREADPAMVLLRVWRSRTGTRVHDVDGGEILARQ
jgi:hypothetical protein